MPWDTDGVVELFVAASWCFALVAVLVLGLQQHLHRKTARFKRVLNALVGSEVYRTQQTSDDPDAFLKRLRFGRMPRRHWEVLLRFRARWLQTEHNPFDVRHVRMLLLTVTDRGGVAMHLLHKSALSRLDAVNQATSRYGYDPLSPSDLPHGDNADQHLVFKLPGASTYLIVEPTEPRRRWALPPEGRSDAPAAPTLAGSPQPSTRKPAQLPSLPMGGPQMEWY